MARGDECNKTGIISARFASQVERRRYADAIAGADWGVTKSQNSRKPTSRG